jgi:crotonobetainyl-CoA:carnitine CoA-transferase CaiB-like acyl-CoA transferase
LIELEPPAVLAAHGFRPLAGRTVIDMTTSLAGPYCTLVLGALGANVIKIERPGTGDDGRSWGPPFWGGESAMFLSVNASKRSIEVDLKQPAGVEIVLRLAESASVFVESLRDGAADALGLGFDAISARSKEIVYCSISAFGDEGPLKGRPGYDPLMQAMSGLMSVTGEADGPPVRVGTSVVDQGTGLWCAIGILAALANDPGTAQRVDAALFETAVNWLPYQLVGYLSSGIIPQRHGSAMPILAPNEAFPTRDGAIMIAAGNDRLFTRLCQSLGVDGLSGDPRFLTNADRVENRAELHQILAARLRNGTSAEWAERFDVVGVPSAPVLDLAEVVAHPQTAALNLLQAIPHPNVPDLRIPAPPLKVNGQRVQHRTPPPTLGQHTVEILTEVGYSDSEIAEFVAHQIVNGQQGQETSEHLGARER